MLARLHIFFITTPKNNLIVRLPFLLSKCHLSAAQSAWTQSQSYRALLPYRGRKSKLLNWTVLFRPALIFLSLSLFPLGHHFCSHTLNQVVCVQRQTLKDRGGKSSTNGRTDTLLTQCKVERCCTNCSSFCFLSSFALAQQEQTFIIVITTTTTTTTTSTALPFAVI